MTKQLAKFCPGCGYPIVMMMLDKILKKNQLSNKAVLGLDIGCSLLGINSLPINTFQTHHGRVTPVMSGFKRANNQAICIGMTGDGGAYAIGLQNLLHAARRDENVTVIVINNSLYAMTGGQSAPTTLQGQKTVTNPSGNSESEFFGPELLSQVVQPGAYLARSAVNDPKNLMESLEKAIITQQKGHFALLEVLISCPTNWKTQGAATIKRLNELKEIYKVGEIKK